MSKIIYRGHTLDWQTADMLDIVERRLGGSISVIQGSYNSGVSASAGTHDKAGAVDVWPIGKTPAALIHQMRFVGFAAWERNPSQGPWPWHCHGIVCDMTGLSSGAANQVVYYRRGLNGLASHLKDDSPRIIPLPTWKSFLAKHPRALAVSLAVLRVQFVTKGKTRSLDVARLQRCLKYVGGYELAEDGHYGAKTVAAMKAYQKKIGAPSRKGGPSAGAVNKLLAGHYKVVVV